MRREREGRGWVMLVGSWSFRNMWIILRISFGRKRICIGEGLAKGSSIGWLRSDWRLGWRPRRVEWNMREKNKHLLRCLSFHRINSLTISSLLLWTAKERLSILRVWTAEGSRVLLLTASSLIQRQWKLDLQKSRKDKFRIIVKSQTAHKASHLADESKTTITLSNSWGWQKTEERVC